jgi:translation initiation factor IF-1
VSKKDLVELSGTVVEMAHGIYRVKCDNGHIIQARMKKRLLRHRIRIVLGDGVVVGVSPYDPSRGFITYRR